VTTEGHGTLGVDCFPKIDQPLVTVITRFPGAAPQEVETQVTQRIEGALNTIDVLDTLTSNSSEGVSFVTAQVNMEKNGDVATPCSTIRHCGSDASSIGASPSTAERAI